MKMHVEMIWKLKLRYSKTIYLGLGGTSTEYLLKVRGEIKNFSTYFDSKQLHCGLFSFMGAKLLQISVKKWVPLIHKQTYLTNHETVLMYRTSEHIPTN